MNPYAVHGLIYITIYLYLMLVVLRFNKKRDANRVFAVFILTVITWSISESMRKIVIPPSIGYEMFWYHDYAIFFAKTMSISAGFMLATFYHFSAVFPKRRMKTSIIIAYIPVLIYVPIILFLDEFIRDVKPTHEGYGIVYGSLIGPAIALMIIYSALISYNLLRSYTETKSLLQRSQIKTIFIGAFLTMLMGIITVSMISSGIGIPFWMPESTFLLPLLIFVSYAVIKYQLLDVEMLVRNSIISFVTAFLMAGLGVSIVWGVAFLFLSVNLGVFAVLTLLVMTVIIFGYNLIKESVTSVVELLFPRLKWSECKLSEAFLVNTSGVVLVHTETKEKTGVIDSDIVGGMLTAIQDFVKESFHAEDRETLRTLSVGKIKMLIEHSSNAYIAVVFTGYETEELRSDICSLLKKIDGTYGRILMEWDGDKEKIRGIESMVNNLFPATA